jgi:hypothetical protein
MNGAYWATEGRIRQELAELDPLVAKIPVRRYPGFYIGTFPKLWLIGQRTLEYAIADQVED